MDLSDDAERAIAQLIERRELHANLALCLPVPIRHVARDEGWDLYYRDDMTTLYGFAIVNGPVKVMTINGEIGRPWQRHAIAHEMGHLLNGDPGSIHLCHQWPWLAEKTERRASIAAGKLLIPDAAIHEMSTMAEIAAYCDVPMALVELRITAHQDVAPRRVTFVPNWKVA